MSKTEWFRRTSWTTEDAADFAARLRRSRTAYHKAQYLRIQAGHLGDAGQPELTRAALQLLDQLLAEYPDPSQLSMANLQRAECLAGLGRPEEALAAYQEALAAQRRLPQWKNNAYLGFGELALALRRADLYDEVLSALREFGGDSPFPADRFREAAIRAFIADERQEPAAAREWARRALDEAALTESPLRYHRKVGLVGREAGDTLKRLKRLSA